MFAVRDEFPNRHLHAMQLHGRSFLLLLIHTLPNCQTRDHEDQHR
jgi:hypothetical protein